MDKGWYFLTELQKRRLVEESGRRGVSVSEVLRGIITAHYGLPEERVEVGKLYVSPGFEGKKKEPSA